MRPVLRRVATLTGIAVLAGHPSVASADGAACLALIEKKMAACAAPAKAQGAVDAAQAEVAAAEQAVEAAKQAATTPDPADPADPTAAPASPASPASPAAPVTDATDVQGAETRLAQARSALAAAEQQLSASTAAVPDAELCANMFPVPEPDACRTLSAILGGKLVDSDTKPGAKVVALADAASEPERVTANNKSGSAAQAEPVGTARTINLAGGAVSLAGTKRGTQAVATLTINPWAIGAEPEEVEASRFTDVSVVVPFDLDSDGGESVQFVGVRARVNIAALTHADGLARQLDAYLQEAGKFEDALGEILSESSDPGACFEQVWRGGAVTAQACGQTLDDKRLQQERSEAHARIAEARKQADRYYFGLDLRGDFGNQALVSESDANGFGLLTAAAAGARVDVGTTWDLELRFRAGGSYFRSKADHSDGTQLDPIFYFDGAAGLVLSGPISPKISKQRLGFGLGLEGRAGIDPDADAEAKAASPKDFIDVVAMIAVPMANGSDLSVGLRLPVKDAGDDPDRSTTLSVGGDFGVFGGS